MKLLHVLLVTFAMVPTAETQASPLDCEGIHDSDARNFCRALTTHSKTWCEFIKDHDMKLRCRAETK